MLEDCVQKHNVFVRQVVWSPAIQLAVKDIKDYMTSTGYVGPTLDPTAEALSENSTLDYTHRQVDGILRALRMDLRFYRLTLLMCTIGLIIIAPTFVALYSKYNSTYIAMIAAVLCLVAMVAVLPFAIVAWKKIIYNERLIQKYTEQLWERNFLKYSYQVDWRISSGEIIDNYWLNIEDYEEWLYRERIRLEKREKALEEREAQFQEQEKQRPK